MSKIFWKSLLASPVILGTALVVSAAANAAENTTATEAIQIEPNQIAQTAPIQDNTELFEQLDTYNQEGGEQALDQVTNISELRDVSPGDWAFEALRNLVERYDCIEGYPNRTYRGNRALTRYEFAAGLNACLSQIERLIIETNSGVSPEDLQRLQRLVQEFEAELATLGARVDNLEGRVAFLEDHQFSTTTKLEGEVIFAISDEFLDNAGGGNNTVFQDRVRLLLNTSFTGKDNLYTRLTAGNAPLGNQFTLDGNNVIEGTQTYNVFNSGGNNVIIDWLAYYTTIELGGAELSTYISAFGGIHSDYAPTLNPYFEDFDGGNGALSAFASENPIYRIGGGAGGAVNFSLGLLEGVLGPTTLTVGYLSGPGAENPADDNGLFNGEYAALGQLNFNLGDRIGLGFTYVHGYHNAGGNIFDLDGTAPIVGTALANNPTSLPGVASVPLVTNSYGIEAALRLSETISISAFGTYTDVILIGRGDSEIWTYGGGIAFSDFGKEGNVLGIFGGVQPYAGHVNAPGIGDINNENPIHIEGFYKYQLSDNISITPGLIWIQNPGQNNDNDDALIGTLRTTFTF